MLDITLEKFRKINENNGMLSKDISLSENISVCRIYEFNKNTNICRCSYNKEVKICNVIILINEVLNNKLYITNPSYLSSCLLFKKDSKILVVSEENKDLEQSITNYVNTLFDECYTFPRTADKKKKKIIFECMRYIENGNIEHYELDTNEKIKKFVLNRILTMV